MYLRIIMKYSSVPGTVTIAIVSYVLICQMTIIICFIIFVTEAASNINL